MIETKNVSLPRDRQSAKCSVCTISLDSHKILLGGYSVYSRFVDEVLERLINFYKDT